MSECQTLTKNKMGDFRDLDELKEMDLGRLCPQILY